MEFPAMSIWLCLSQLTSTLIGMTFGLDKTALRTVLRMLNNWCSNIGKAGHHAIFDL